MNSLEAGKAYHPKGLPGDPDMKTYCSRIRHYFIDSGADNTFTIRVSSYFKSGDATEYKALEFIAKTMRLQATKIPMGGELPVTKEQLDHITQLLNTFGFENSRDVIERIRYS